MLGMPASTVPRSLAALAVAVAVLAGCGESAVVVQAEKDGAVVGDAVQSRSEETGSDITTTLTEDPWKGESDAFVSGTYDFLVVNTEDGGCAKLVFDSDEPGAGYTIEDAYEC